MMFGVSVLIFRLHQKTPGTSRGSTQWSPDQLFVLSVKTSFETAPVALERCPTDVGLDEHFDFEQLSNNLAADPALAEEVGYVRLPSEITELAKANYQSRKTGTQFLNEKGEKVHGPLAKVYK